MPIRSQAPPKRQILKYHSQNQGTRMVAFDINEDYVLDEVVGEGAYGIVAAGTHIPSGKQVAIKKIHPFERPLFCLRTLREIKLLRHFDNENIITVLEILKPQSYELMTDVYLVQNLMDADLSRVIRSQTLSDDHCQYFTYQTLRALKALHSANVLHRDLKPGNILINANCDLKICDFGLARLASSQTGDDSNVGYMTEYVATRWYRAPEIMLTFNHYSKAIDMWSVGCILAEMLGRTPLFPGKDYSDQLHLILSTLGTPSDEDYYSVKSRRARQYIQSLPPYKAQSFAKLFPRANPLAVDLIEKLLKFNPSLRITVDEALAHPYLAGYHDQRDEPTGGSLPSSFFDFEKGTEISVTQMKRHVYDEIMNYPKSRILAPSQGYLGTVLNSSRATIASQDMAGSISGSTGSSGSDQSANSRVSMASNSTTASSQASERVRKVTEVV